MPMLFHFIAESVDVLGIRVAREMIVIAGDEEEAKDEVAAYFAMHDEVERWNIAHTMESRELKADDPHALDYRDKGPHSYIGA